MSQQKGLYEYMEFHIVGETAMMQHNGQLADPENWFVQELGTLTGKRDKTPDIYKRIYDLHWEGGLYLDRDKTVVVPGRVLRGALFRAGKTRKLGQQVLRSVFVPKDWPVLVDGDSKNVEDIRNDDNFRDLQVVVIKQSGNSKVMRCRPVFHNWELKFELKYRPDLISAFTLYELVLLLGRDIGLSDDNKMGGGRFEILSPAEPPDQQGQTEKAPKAKGRKGKNRLTEVEPELTTNGDGNGSFLLDSEEELDEVN